MLLGNSTRMSWTASCRHRDAMEVLNAIGTSKVTVLRSTVTQTSNVMFDSPTAVTLKRWLGRWTKTDVTTNSTFRISLRSGSLPSSFVNIRRLSITRRLVLGFDFGTSGCMCLLSSDRGPRVLINAFLSQLLLLARRLFNRLLASRRPLPLRKIAIWSFNSMLCFSTSSRIVRCVTITESVSSMWMITAALVVRMVGLAQEASMASRLLLIWNKLVQVPPNAQNSVPLMATLR